MKIFSVMSGALLALLTLPVVAEDATVPVEILVSGVASQNGQLTASAYRDRDTWLSDDTAGRISVALAEADIEQPVRIVMELPAGDYAFSVYHDANDNGKLDTNRIGLPAEPVGLSNDHRPRFGPPRFNRALVSVSENDKQVPVRLQ